MSSVSSTSTLSIDYAKLEGDFFEPTQYAFHAMSDDCAMKETSNAILVLDYCIARVRTVLNSQSHEDEAREIIHAVFDTAYSTILSVTEGGNLQRPDSEESHEVCLARMARSGLWDFKLNEVKQLTQEASDKFPLLGFDECCVSRLWPDHGIGEGYFATGIQTSVDNV